MIDLLREHIPITSICSPQDRNSFPTFKHIFKLQSCSKPTTLREPLLPSTPQNMNLLVRSTPQICDAMISKPVLGFLFHSDAATSSEWDNATSHGLFSNFSQGFDLPECLDSPLPPSSDHSRWEWPRPLCMPPYQTSDPNGSRYFRRHTLMHVSHGLASAGDIQTLHLLTRRAVLANIREYRNQEMNFSLSSSTASSMYSQDYSYLLSKECSSKVVWRLTYWDPPELATDISQGSSGTFLQCPSPRTRDSTSNLQPRQSALPDLREYMRTHTRFSFIKYEVDDEERSPLSSYSSFSTILWNSIDWNPAFERDDHQYNTIHQISPISGCLFSLDSPTPYRPVNTAGWTLRRPPTPRYAVRSWSFNSDVNSFIDTIPLPSLSRNHTPCSFHSDGVSVFDVVPLRQHYRIGPTSRAFSFIPNASEDFTVHPLPLFDTEVCESPASFRTFNSWRDEPLAINRSIPNTEDSYSPSFDSMTVEITTFLSRAQRISDHASPVQLGITRHRNMSPSRTTTSLTDASAAISLTICDLYAFGCEGTFVQQRPHRQRWWQRLFCF